MCVLEMRMRLYFIEYYYAVCFIRIFIAVNGKIIIKGCNGNHFHRGLYGNAKVFLTDTELRQVIFLPFSGSSCMTSHCRENERFCAPLLQLIAHGFQ